MKRRDLIAELERIVSCSGMVQSMTFITIPKPANQNLCHGIAK